ncbi:NTP-binding protein [Actinomadura sp. LD22]|uniref:NTP-binding protein n=2 Tax=Actinomadura physcomitrii TaxID=2650748 RepID=A0A6I4MB99_9ACTN|nr:NTP-binding protein [Actinomadura physcomitrii]
MAVAREILKSWQYDGLPTLRNWCGAWMRWDKTHWSEIEDREIRSTLYRRLEHAKYAQLVNKGRGENKCATVEIRPWAPNKRKISDLIEAMAAICHLPESVQAPSWIGRGGGERHGAIVACRNGLLRLSDRKLLPLTPGYFNLVSVPFDYDPAAPEPTQWLDFLSELWPTTGRDDEHGKAEDADAIASIRAVQEYFGYVLSGRTHLQKIFMMLGPSRSGKGTIARTLTALLGAGNVAGPTMASLATNFGMASLIGKPFAIISDARLAGNTGNQVVERLLTISGEDRVEVDRKYKQAWTGRLPTRFLILSNVMPQFGDASGVIAHRFIVLTMTRSWLHNEDTELEGKLNGELGGILNWALDGLDRLTEQGRLTEPRSSVESVTAMKDIASPTSAFVRDCCDTGAEHQVTVDEIWAAWKEWCEDNGRGSAGSKQIFGRNLQAVAPQVRMIRPRVDGKQVRTYSGIKLKDSTESDAHNKEDRDSSDSPRLTAAPEPDSEPRESLETRSSLLRDQLSGDVCEMTGCDEPAHRYEHGAFCLPHARKMTPRARWAALGIEEGGAA